METAMSPSPSLSDVLSQLQQSRAGVGHQMPVEELVEIDAAPSESDSDDADSVGSASSCGTCSGGGPSSGAAGLADLLAQAQKRGVPRGLGRPELGCSAGGARGTPSGDGTRGPHASADAAAGLRPLISSLLSELAPNAASSRKKTVTRAPDDDDNDDDDGEDDDEDDANDANDADDDDDNDAAADNGDDDDEDDDDNEDDDDEDDDDEDDDADDSSDDYSSDDDSSDDDEDEDDEDDDSRDDGGNSRDDSVSDDGTIATGTQGHVGPEVDRREGEGAAPLGGQSVAPPPTLNIMKQVYARILALPEAQ
jgi:hypothetical protein